VRGITAGKWQRHQLPTAHPDRVVSIRNWDVSALNTEGKALHDFALWCEQVNRKGLASR
jgi:hypothetical protein